MSDEVMGSLKRDVTSLDVTQKDELVKNGFIATNDVKDKKSKAQKTRKTTVDMGIINGIKLAIVATDTTIPKKGKNTEEKINELGLDFNITQALLKQKNDGEINTNHVNDIIHTNLVDDISELSHATQKQITDTIIKNRNEYNSLNKEEVSFYILKSGKINGFLLDNWYNGLMKFIEKLFQLSSVNEEIINHLSSDKRKILISKIKEMIKAMDKLIILIKKSK